MSIASSTVVSFRTDKKLKKQVESIFDELGISTSAAINMFFKQCARKRAIPFELSIEEEPEEREFSPKLLAAIEEAEAIERGEIKRKGYHDVDELFRDLLAGKDMDEDDEN